MDWFSFSKSEKHTDSNETYDPENPKKAKDPRAVPEQGRFMRLPWTVLTSRASHNLFLSASSKTER